MKIAINCVFFTLKGGGVKEYIYNLVWNLSELDVQHEFVLYFLEDMMDYARENLPSNFKMKSIGFSSKQIIRRSLFEQSFWNREEEIEDFDLFHSPFFHAPIFKRAKVVLTVHDLRFKVFPKTYTKLRFLFLNYKVPRSIRRADHLISISNFTKSEIIRFYSVPDERVTTILEAINTSFFDINNVAESNIIKGPFILTVGHVEPRKNYARLIEAFDKFVLQYPQEEIKLVIVGKLSHDYKEFLESIKGSTKIVYLNFVDSPTLLWLYKNAKLFIFPTIYEGFGFPPLEATAMGNISAVSNVSSLPEVCGDGARYFDPLNVDDIVQSMVDTIFDDEYRKVLLKKSRTNLQRFSWKKNAVETLKIYEAQHIKIYENK